MKQCPLAILVLICLCQIAKGASVVRKFSSVKIVNPMAFYPEGPQLIDDGLLVAEMPRDRIVLIGTGDTRSVWSEPGCGPTSIKKISTGGYWVLCHLGNHVVKLDSKFHTIATVSGTSSGRKLTWPNDGSTDSKGNLYVSSSGPFSLQAPAEGRIVFVEAKSNFATDVAEGYRYTNGVLVQEARKRILVSEHLNQRLLSFPIIKEGELGKPKEFFNFKKAPLVKDSYAQSGPDGLAVFTNGDIAVADYGNGRILFLSETGQYLSQLKVKYRFVTNMAISSDQKFLYVTMTESNSTQELHGIVEKFSISTRGSNHEI